VKHPRQLAIPARLSSSNATSRPQFLNVPPSVRDFSMRDLLTQMERTVLFRSHAHRTHGHTLPALAVRVQNTSRDVDGGVVGQLSDQ
jgi:hypothetical protein